MAEQSQEIPEGKIVEPKSSIDASARNGELVDTIRQVVTELLADEEDEQILVQQHAEFHTGPLPSPRSLEQYEKISPGISREFLDEWKKEAAHRRSLNGELMRGAASRAARAQHYALSFAVCALLASAALAFLGAPTAAGIVGSSTVLGVVAAFLSAKIYGEKTAPSDQRHSDSQSSG